MLFRLWFSEGSSPELIKIALVSADGLLLNESVRGQFAFGRAQSTFAWTTGVQALAILLLREALSQQSAPAQRKQLSILTGERGSPATTIDYALSKQPQWVADICGVTKTGRPRLAELLSVSNSNGKRSGPISVWLKAESSYSIFVGREQIIQREQLAALLSRLESSWQPYGTKRIKAAGRENRSVTSHSATDFSKLVSDLVKAEVDTAFRTVNIYSSRELNCRLKTLQSDPSFVRVAGKSAISLVEERIGLPASLRSGIFCEEHQRALVRAEKFLKVGVGMCNVGSLTLFSYLERLQKLPLLVDASFAHALEIATRIINKDPFIDHDLVAIASAPAATLIANQDTHDYLPLMFLPSNSQRIVRTKRKVRGRERTAKKVVSLLHEQPSTVLFYYEQLKARSHFKLGENKLLHHEPWESFECLASGDEDLESVLFFPFAQLNVAYNSCELVDSPSLPSGSADVILFAHKSLVSDKRRLLAICAAIRSGWCSLLESREQRELSVESFVADPKFLSNLKRVAGLSGRAF